MYILSKIQWGFWKVFSVHHCLLLLLEKYRNDLDKGDFSGIAMTDLLKYLIVLTISYQFLN